LIVNYDFQEVTYVLLLQRGVQFSGGKVCGFQAEKTAFEHLDDLFNTRCLFTI
jgi:hypothetical protein